MDVVPLVWLAPPTATDTRAATRWAEARGVALAPPFHDPNVANQPDSAHVALRGESALRASEAAADEVENLIERANERLASLDLGDAETPLAEAEAVLRAHPELPQAAWLRAEVERGWSRRWLRGGGSDLRAERAWKRAAALDDGRLAGIGERAFPSPLRLQGTLVPAGPVTTSSAVRIDGGPAAAGTFTRAAGEHQLVQTNARGETTYAAWFGFTGGVVRLAAIDDAAGSAPPCSAPDLDAVQVSEGLSTSPGSRCPTWVVARPAGGPFARTTIAFCHAGVCAPFEPIDDAVADVRGASEAPRTANTTGTWLPWAIAGAGAAVVAGVAIVLATRGGGSPSPQTHFVNGGLTTTSTPGFLLPLRTGGAR